MISEKKISYSLISRKILLQGNTWRKKLLHCKKNLSWRLKLEKEPFTIVFQEKFYHQRIGEKWEGLGASFPFVVKATSCRDVRRHI